MTPGRPFRTLAFWALVILLSLVAYRMYQGSFMTPPRVEISYTRFIDEVNKGNISNLQIVERAVTGELRRESTIRISGHDTSFKNFRTNILGDGENLPERVWQTNPAIEIEVKNGVVILNGRVPGLASKRLAGVLAWWVPGARDVVNGIAVEPPEEDSPDAIEEAVRIALDKDPFVDASQVRVGVRNRTVRLTGAVRSPEARDAAEWDAWYVFGVDDVINDLGAV